MDLDSVTVWQINLDCGALTWLWNAEGAIALKPSFTLTSNTWHTFSQSVALLTLLWKGFWRNRLVDKNIISYKLRT